MDYATYKVVILSANPEEDQKRLNELAREGFQVVTTYCEDRVILRKVVKGKP